MAWEEVEVAGREKRHEIVLSGKDISERIDQHGLDNNVYSLTALNFLEISSTSLGVLSSDVGQLSNLTNLVLCCNQLQQVPSTIGNLSKLKLLDLSRNKIQLVPDEISKLVDVQTLNLSGNQLSSFPDISSLGQLHILDVSHNQLEALPEGLTTIELLAQIFANGNAITALSPDLHDLPSLKTLDVSDNKLSDIPLELAECFKLKEFKYGNNKLKDRRLAKMGEQCTTKAVLDYLRTNLEKERQKSGGGKKDKIKKKKKKGGKGHDDMEELQNAMKVLHFNETENMSVKIDAEMANIRPYIVCCIARNLDFNVSQNMFKRFINLQTKLHDEVCEKRQAATIATHDLKLLKTPLSYEARAPDTISLTPLFKMKEVTASKLVAKLRQEAEEFRKEKKRNTLSGVHKYLDLLKGKASYPVLMDREGTVVSFPPITNSDATKISRETTDLFLEVTSTVSLDTCKKVMQELLQNILEMGLGLSDAGSEAGGGQAAAAADCPMTASQQTLTVEQVRVVDQEGSLKVVYPSRVDLQSEAFIVIRE